ncbi:hypothetical protein KR215_011061 [Drosophila sulfurigaster]|uniref:uncharacterized protein LOC133850178 n=1 Tax=Drosophila sulfurigaster albostrigata TaxID=89887 RepID=UPI002D21ED74|nr:uncharacterized protein LOC133850178 [Drosophila sulfurigaster albostrigata]KAH8415016.1 hypothetical protein KR215_011061 [Drosophila sulfurigaster]
MPRRKPTFKTDVIGTLDLNPEEAVGEYLLSRQQERFFVKPPNWDSAGDSVEMLYIENARENEAMQVLQRQLLEEAQRQTELNHQRIASMYRMQERLRKRFIEVNGFIKDCADKKRAAEKIIREQEGLHEELSRGIDDYKTSISELQSFRRDLKETVHQFQPYERVLDDVVKISDIFVSPKDCMDRCDALMLAQVEINELKNTKLQEIEEMRQRMVKITSEAALTVLGLKNDLAKLERSYNQSRALGLKWEKTLSLCKDTTSNNDLDKERALDGIQILYRMMCKRRDIDATFSRREVEKCLDFVKREVELLVSVLREMERSTQKGGKSANQDGALCG